MNRRRLVLAAALGALALGVAEVLVPGQIPLDAGELAVTVLGLAVLAYGVVVLRGRSQFAYREAATSTPEDRWPAPTPGEDFDEAVSAFVDRETQFVRPDTRRELREAAIRVLQRFEARSEAEATRLVDEGAWTDDPLASDYLSADGPPAFAPLRTIRGLVSEESVLERYRRHAVGAIARVAEVDGAERVVEGKSRPLLGLVSRESKTDVVRNDHGARASDDPADESGIPLRTNHWFGVSLVAVVALGVGVIVERPGLVLAAVVGVGFAAYARTVPLGAVDLAIDRSVSDPRPDPDDDVAVTVTVTNRGSRILPDVRLIDGVPSALAVAEGTPRHGTALRPGESATVTYAVRASRGIHEFGPATVLVRNWPGSIERREAPADETTITCVPTLQASPVEVPLRSQVTKFTGVVDTDTGGQGLEFFATRQYQPGDARNRIDWSRLARTGELATLEFREERSASVVLLVDVRDGAYSAPDREGRHAVDRSVDAAGRAFARLLEDGHRVGLATMGRRDCWLEPGTGSDHRHRGQQLLATDPAFATTPADAEDGRIWWQTHLRRRLPADAQVIVFSPLTDRRAMRTVKDLEARGHRCTVISPDPTAARTPGNVVVRIRRRINVVELRSAGVPVVDWPADRSFENALARHADGRRP